MDILRLLAKRFVGMGVIVTISSFLLACLTWLLPGDPAALLVAGSGTPEIIAEIRKELHLDAGIFGYWWHWFSNLLHGDFGYYYLNGGKRPLSAVIQMTLPVTLQLIIYAQIVALTFAIPLGLISAYKENGRFDRIVSSTLFTLVSFPGFALALILSGGVGNLIDRVLRGGLVVDFMNVGIGTLRSGIFNVADLGIVGGLVLLLALELFGRRAPSAPSAPVDSESRGNVQ